VYWLWRGLLLLPGLWRVFRLAEPRITFFGGAKVKLTDRWALDARALAKKCVEHNITLITGGGPGVMEAAVLGAKDAQPRKCNCLGISLTGISESRPAAYESFVKVRLLIERKWLMINFSCTCVVFPGGVGTFNEFAEVLELIDLELIHRTPFILYGKDYWQPVLTWVKDVGVAERLIVRDLLNYIILVDDVETAFAWIKRACKTGDVSSKF
jgi:uncharacterized protein (TIGR00730 family)